MKSEDDDGGEWIEATSRKNKKGNKNANLTTVTSDIIVSASNGKNKKKTKKNKGKSGYAETEESKFAGHSSSQVNSNGNTCQEEISALAAAGDETTMISLLNQWSQVRL